MSDTKGVREDVLEVLADHERARNDDIFLTLKVWEKRGFPVTDAMYLYARFVPKPSTIKRRRQEIQNDDNAFLPTDPGVFGDRLNAKIMSEEAR